MGPYRFHYLKDNKHSRIHREKFVIKINKSKYWSKIEILVKNRNFGQKSKFWSKIEISEQK